MSVDISTDRSVAFRSTHRPMLDRYVGRHIDRLSADVSIEMCRLTCRSTYRPMCRPICRTLCWPTHLDRYIGRVSVDMSIDRLPTFRRHLTATGVLVTRCSLSRRHNLTLVSDFWWAAQISKKKNKTKQKNRPAAYFFYRNPDEKHIFFLLGLTFPFFLLFLFRIFCIWQYFT